MELRIDNETSVSDLQKQFNAYFPYLQLEFLVDEKLNGRKHRTVRANPNQLIKQLPGFYNPINLSMSTDTTVADLLNRFREIGLQAQVSRKSGNLWIETRFTDDWTLERQNKEAILFSISNQHFLNDNSRQIRN